MKNKIAFSFLLISLVILIANVNYTFTNNEKIKAIYGVPATRNAVKLLRTLKINTVFVKPNYSSAQFFKKNGFKVFVDFSVFFNTKMLKFHPKLNAIGRNGYTLPKVSWYQGISPTVKWYRKLQLRKIKHIIKSFPIDGLYLDFIRFPIHWEKHDMQMLDSCFAPHSLKQFEEYSNIKIPNSLNSTRKKSNWILKNHKKAWVKFKCHIITSFVSKVREYIDSSNPKIKLGVFMIPWTNKDYNNAIRRIAGQDIRELKKHVNYISPMVYHKLLKCNIEWLIKTFKYFSKKSDKKLLPILQAFSIKPFDLIKALRIADTYPESHGYILFGYKHLNRKKVHSLKRYFLTPYERRSSSIN